MNMYFFKYRNNEKIRGNCFSVSFINGCLFLGDDLLERYDKPELEVFGKEALESNNDLEFEPAMKYLIEKGYKTRVIDEGNLQPYGKYLKHENVLHTRRPYKQKDLFNLNSQKYVVIPATWYVGKPHAVLIYDSKVYDPTNETTLNIGVDLNKKIFDIRTVGEDSPFLIAFKLA